jgi:nitrate/nitrite transporter NarK
LGGRSAYRLGLRRWYVAGPLFVCGAALAVSTLGSGAGFALVALTIATSGVLLALAQFWNLPTAYLAGVGAAGGIALVNSIGSLAGFASPWIVGLIKQSTGSTDVGILIMAAVIVLGSALTLFIPARLVEDWRKAPDRAAPIEAAVASLPSAHTNAL